jgi:acyl-CoA reductase-like NAD-dependent aldehyde dehydrogenase
MAITTTNPATGEVLKKFEPLSAEQLERKLQLAADAFRRHRTTPFAERAAKMIRIAEILEKEKDECILAIMPWNFPFWQVFRFVAPALMAGNVGLLKHASNVPQCALKIEEIIRRAGFAEGVFQTLLIGSEYVDGILNDLRVVAATLTGSEQAGIQVGISAAKRIKKVVLELGGSDPFIVMPSADLDAAVATAIDARIQNNGQSCIAAKRFIVSERIADDFERKFVKRMQELRVGDPFDESTQLGPLASADAVTSLDADVKKTVAAGARVLTGGRPLDRPGYFYAPTVLTDIPKNSPAYREEFFGPTTTASDWAPAHGPTMSQKRNGSSTSSMPAWFFSTRWWRPTRVSRSEA